MNCYLGIIPGEQTVEVRFGPKRSVRLLNFANPLISQLIMEKTDMTWLIHSFSGIGPIKFGMTPEDVATHIGTPDRSRRGLRSDTFSEHRGTKAPIVRYRGNRVREIEAFYDIGVVMFRGISIFETNGLKVLRALEQLNGGAAISAGIILFDKLGLTAGRLDEDPPTGHSVTAFTSGTWDGKTADFKSISFNDR